MSKLKIEVGKSYVNKSGRSERQVIQIGSDLPVQWNGRPENKPNEPVVQYRNTRMGLTHYANSRLDTMYLSSFERWARKEVPRETTK